METKKSESQFNITVFTLTHLPEALDK